MGVLKWTQSGFEYAHLIVKQAVYRIATAGALSAKLHSLPFGMSYLMLVHSFLTYLPQILLPNWNKALVNAFQVVLLMPY